MLSHVKPSDTPSDAAGFVDYSQEMTISKNPVLRTVFSGLGLVFVGLGIIGAFLPVMPTTVFLLIAAYFFARSSPRFYNWLMNHKQFGRFIRDWRAGLGIPLKAKITAVTLIALTIGSSAIFFVPNLIAKLILVLVGVGVSTYLITRPTKQVSGS